MNPPRLAVLLVPVFVSFLIRNVLDKSESAILVFSLPARHLLMQRWHDEQLQVRFLAGLP